PVRFQPARKPARGDLQRGLLHARGIAALDQRVVVGQEIERFGIVAPAGRDRRADRADVVAEVGRAGRGDAGQAAAPVHGRDRWASRGTPVWKKGNAKHSAAPATDVRRRAPRGLPRRGGSRRAAKPRPAPSRVGSGVHPRRTPCVPCSVPPCSPPPLPWPLRPAPATCSTSPWSIAIPVPPCRRTAATASSTSRARRGTVTRCA